MPVDPASEAARASQALHLTEPQFCLLGAAMTSDLARLLQAAEFAADRHREHRRKDPGASPYINHPLTVAALLAGEGGVLDVPLLMAALLHDTVEDTDTSPQELAEWFGDDVQRLVAEVTDDKSLPKARRKQLQIEAAPHKSDRAKQLKIADKVCNIRDLDGDSPANWDRDRKLQYLVWAERVVAGCRGVNEKLDALFDEAVAAARDRISA